LPTVDHSCDVKLVCSLIFAVSYNTKNAEYIVGGFSSLTKSMSCSQRVVQIINNSDNILKMCFKKY